MGGRVLLWLENAAVDGITNLKYTKQNEKKYKHCPHFVDNSPVHRTHRRRT